MKVKHTPFVSGQDVGIESMSVTYTQQADTNSSSDEEQFLTIETQTVPAVEDECPFYYNIKIKDCDHWSVEDASDLIALFDDFRNRLKQTKE